MREMNYRPGDYSLGDRVKSAYQSVVEQMRALFDYGSRLGQVYLREPILVGVDGRCHMPNTFLTRSRGKDKYRRTDKKLTGSGKDRSNRQQRKRKHR